MNTRAFVALAGGLAVAGAVSAQNSAFTEEHNSASDVPVAARAAPGALPIDDHVPNLNHDQLVINHDLHDGHTEVDEITHLTDISHDVFEAVLISAVPVQLPNSNATATQYTFSVTEWFKGDVAAQTMTYTEVGYLDEEGVGAYTCLSHKLYVGSRYMVFGRENPQEMILPFERVLQVKDGGRVLGNERGQAAIRLDNNTIVFGGDADLDPLTYDNRRLDDTNPVTDSGPPTPTDGSIQPPQVTSDAPAPKPIDGQLIIDSIRNITWGQTDASGAAFDPPAGFAEPLNTDNRWSSCGWTNNPYNYRGWIPGASELSWFMASGNDWNNLVQAGGSGGSWLIGHFSDWTELPGFGDGVNDTGLPTDTMMVSGGYGGNWAALGNPNGIAWTWKSGCGEISQTDAFCNPSLTGNELQFRKSMVHELGHNLSLAHVTSTFGIMVSGTWRVPPNYTLNSNYCRIDDYRGVRNVLDFANGVLANTWWHSTFTDMSTTSQTVESSVYTMATLNDYSLQSGQAFTIDGMHVENRGLASASSVSIKWYLSTNTIISSGDTQVGSGSWSTFVGNSLWQNGTFNLSVPSSMSSGTYYLGWILTTPTSELTSNNNTGIMRWSSSSSFAQRTVTVTCPTPSIPTGVSSTDGSSCSGVTVSWSAASGATSYDVYRSISSSTSGMTLVGNNVASPYFDSTGTPGQTYYYRVRSNNGCGSQSGNSAYNTGWRNSVPSAPTGASVTNGTICGKVLVDWNAVSGASSYTLYRNTINDIGTATFVVSVASSLTQWFDAGGPAATGIYYFVRANGTCGAGPYATSVWGYYFNSEADLTTTGAGIGDPGFGVPDGQVTSADINYYVNAWVGGNTAIADVTTTGAGVGDPGFGVPDGQITGTDINYYVNIWVLGCN